MDHKKCLRDGIGFGILMFVFELGKQYFYYDLTFSFVLAASFWLPAGILFGYGSRFLFSTLKNIKS